MRLGTRLATAFALVAVVVAATVGALSYQAAAFRITTEIDRSLQSTTTAIAGGQEAVLDTPVFDLRTVRREGRPIPADQTQELAAQRVAPDGSVHHVGGRDIALPVGAAERALTQRGARGAATTEVTMGDDTYRVLTTALGDTEVDDDGDSSGRGALQVAVDIDGSRRVLNDLAMEILAVSVVVALVAGLAGWLLARRIARRLVRLTEVTEQVAAGGPGGYDEPVDHAGGGDEIARLTSSFRTMLSSLTEARETQERLVQDAAHELRTPLTSLRTNARVLRRFSDLSPSSREELVADVDGETRELSALVDELVALALTRGGRRARGGPGPRRDRRAGRRAGRAPQRPRGLAARRRVDGPRAPHGPRARRGQPDRERREVRRRGERADRGRGLGRDGHRGRPRPGDRRRAGPAGVRPLLPGRGRPVAARLRSRARDRARRRRDPRRRGVRRQPARWWRRRRLLGGWEETLT